MWLLLASMSALQPAAARADSRAQKYYYEAITEPFFIPDAARPGWYRSQREGGEKSSFPAVKAPGTFRVFVLGGSIAQLLAIKRGKGALDDALREALPSLKVEVLNCGMAGYDSYREALIEQEILDYEPDLIVFLTGHNEGLGSAPVPIWIMHAQERLSRFGAFRALVKALHREGDNGPLKATRDYDARDKTFAANLAQNIRHARERAVAVAVVVPPRNYREPVELRRMVYDAEFVPGWIRFVQGDAAGARALWKKALDAVPKDKG